MNNILIIFEKDSFKKMPCAVFWWCQQETRYFIKQLSARQRVYLDLNVYLPTATHERPVILLNLEHFPWGSDKALDCAIRYHCDLGIVNFTMWDLLIFPDHSMHVNIHLPLSNIVNYIIKNYCLGWLDDLSDALCFKQESNRLVVELISVFV